MTCNIVLFIAFSRFLKLIPDLDGQIFVICQWISKNCFFYTISLPLGKRKTNKTCLMDSGKIREQIILETTKLRHHIRLSFEVTSFALTFGSEGFADWSFSGLFDEIMFGLDASHMSIFSFFGVDIWETRTEGTSKFPWPWAVGTAANNILSNSSWCLAGIEDLLGLCQSKSIVTSELKK